MSVPEALGNALCSLLLSSSGTAAAPAGRSWGMGLSVSRASLWKLYFRSSWKSPLEAVLVAELRRPQQPLHLFSPSLQ